MNAELDAFKAAHGAAAQAVDDAGGQHDAAHDTARALADSYVAANPAAFTEYVGLDENACVALVDVFREAVARGVPEMESKLWEVEAWLLHHFDPQDIGGAHSATVRTVPEGQ